MSLVHCRLEYDATTQTLADWGIEDCTLRLAIGGEDMLTFSREEGLTAAPGFAAGQLVKLIDPAGVVRFVGVVPMARRDGFKMVYACEGPNFYLKRTPVQQVWKFVVDATFTEKTLALARLGNRAFGDDVAEILAAVNAQTGAPTLTLDNTDVPTYKSPEELQRDQMAFDALRRLLGWSPYLDYRWNYDAGGMQMQFFSVLQSGHGYGGLPANRFARRSISFLGRPGDPENEPAPVFDPQWQWLIRYFKIHWKGKAVVVIGDDVANPGGLTDGVAVLGWTYETDTANASPVVPGAFGGIELTIDLRRGEFNSTARDSDELKVADLALRMGAPRFRPWYGMTWAEMGSTCNFERVPGELYSASDADPRYATADSICQTVLHDLRSGRTSVQTGAPTQLGFRDPELQNRLRRAPTSGDAGGQTYGFEPKEGDGDGAGGDVKMPVFVVNEAGAWVPKYVTVSGTTEDGPTEVSMNVNRAGASPLLVPGLVEPSALLPGAMPGPFAVRINAATSQVYVDKNSKVSTNLKMSSGIEVTGLGSLISVAGTTYIWVEATGNGTDITGVSIQSGGAPWAEYPEPFRLDETDPDNPFQDRTYQLLAIVAAEDAAYPERPRLTIGATTYDIDQRVTTHLLLCEGCIDGEDRVVFKPSSGQGIPA